MPLSTSSEICLLVPKENLPKLGSQITMIQWLPVLQWASWRCDEFTVLNDQTSTNCTVHFTRSVLCNQNCKKSERQQDQKISTNESKYGISHKQLTHKALNNPCLLSATSNSAVREPVQWVDSKTAILQYDLQYDQCIDPSLHPMLLQFIASESAAKEKSIQQEISKEPWLH